MAKRMMVIGTINTYVQRQCGCGTWGCGTKADDEVWIKFSYAREAEPYTVHCGAEAIRYDMAQKPSLRSIEWVHMSSATRRRMLRERPDLAGVPVVVSGMMEVAA